MNDVTPASTWTLDPTHSEAAFTVRHAGISKVRGKFTGLDAVITVDENKEATVNATIDANTFDSGNPDRDAHVRSADFLDVEQFSTLTFLTAGPVDTDSITGELTIHGVTRTVTFNVDFGGVTTDPFGNLRAGVEATTTISRKDFGLTWNAALEAGGVLVSDKVNIIVDASFIKS